MMSRLFVWVCMFSLAAIVPSAQAAANKTATVEGKVKATDVAKRLLTLEVKEGDKVVDKEFTVTNDLKVMIDNGFLSLGDLKPGTLVQCLFDDMNQVMKITDVKPKK